MEDDKNLGYYNIRDEDQIHFLIRAARPQQAPAQSGAAVSQVLYFTTIQHIHIHSQVILFTD